MHNVHADFATHFLRRSQPSIKRRRSGFTKQRNDYLRWVACSEHPPACHSAAGRYELMEGAMQQAPQPSW